MLEFDEYAPLGTAEIPLSVLMVVFLRPSGFSGSMHKVMGCILHYWKLRVNSIWWRNEFF
jgi:hypothetical protein